MKVVCFGEIMMRLNPEGYLRFVQAERFEVTYAGGEANVAVSLANYGLDASFVTKLPSNPLGEAARNAVRHFGVDTKDVVWGGPRLGLYFVEKGASQRASKVVYDRAGSSIASAKRADFDWAKILKGAKWFHFTGITPALGGELPEICLDALEYCRAHKITVSCDLNYRGKLWSKAEAGRCMAKLVPYVDVLIANEADAADVFGIHAAHTDIEGGKLDYEAYKSVAQQISQRFGCKKVAITLRGSISASENTWAGMLYDAATDTANISRSYHIQIVDRVGGGDSFGGGLIYALSNGYNDADAINYAVAASCLKHTIEHDFNEVKVDEVLALMKSLDSEGKYTVSGKIKEGLECFWGGFADVEQTNAAIGKMYEENGYLMDTHTAVAYKVYEQYREETGDDTPALIASTASPYKFAGSVTSSLGMEESEDEFAAVRALEEKTGVKVPSCLKDLDKAPVRHGDVIDIDAMPGAVKGSL
jgi:2-dehydro-3-deoxygluconokinase